MQDEDKRGNDQDDRESRTQARAEEQHVEQDQILIMIAERTGAPGENEQNLQAHRERQIAATISRAMRDLSRGMTRAAPTMSGVTIAA
jgi:hypothetical protein